MNAFLTSRGRRFFPLLAMGCVFACWPSFARADMLTSRFTDRASLTPDTCLGDCSARVVFASQEVEEMNSVDTENVRQTAVAALAVILVIPAEMMAKMETPLPPPPPQQQQQQQQQNNITTAVVPPDGTGHISGGPPTPNTNTNPEPGSLVLALTGSGTALLAWLRRRRSKLPRRNG